MILRDGEAWLLGSHVAPLNTASTHVDANPKRIRKLLLNRREIDRLTGLVERKGYTLVALELYFKRGVAKVALALGKGKQLHDKRATERERDDAREMARAVRER